MFKAVQLLVIVLVMAFCCATPIWAAPSDITSDALLYSVNTVREQNGLPSLMMNEKLIVAARLKAEDMKNNEYWAHINPKTNDTGWTFIQRTGYHYTKAGENLAKDYQSVNGVIQGWLNSPKHKNVMLSKTYTETGIAVIYYQKDGIEQALVVELFALPYQKPESVVVNFISLAFGKVLNNIITL